MLQKAFETGLDGLTHFVNHKLHEGLRKNHELSNPRRLCWLQLNFKLSVKSQIWSSTHAALLKVVQCNAIYLIGLRCIKNPVQLLIDTSLRFCEGVDVKVWIS